MPYLGMRVFRVIFVTFHKFIATQHVNQECSENIFHKHGLLSGKIIVKNVK